MQKQVFKLVGLTCPACKKVSEKRIKSLSGVKSVDVSLSSQQVTIETERKLTVAEINQLLKDTPYRALEK